MAIEKVAVRINAPVVVALQFATGKHVASKVGDDQVLFTCVDGRALYADMPLAGAIYAKGIQAREPIEILKRSSKLFEVRRVKEIDFVQQEGAREPGANQGAPARANVRTTNIPEGSKAPEQPQHSAAEGALRTMKDAVEHEAKPYTLGALRLMGALKDAIDAVREAEKYTTRLGMTLQFSEESVRAFAITAYIQDSKKGGI